MASLCCAVSEPELIDYVLDPLVLLCSFFIICILMYGIIKFFSKRKNSIKTHYSQKDVSIMLKNQNFYSPKNEFESWIDEGELVVEQYMSEAQIGRLVKQYMAETNGMPLKIVFPEYDKGNDQ
ncbi:hypothetical protein AB7Z61_20125 [Providencia rettgeri]